VGEARIRLPQRISRGDTILVHSIVQHPMDTGFFRTTDGQPIPAWFIKGRGGEVRGPAGGEVHLDVGHQP
jgi:hypothetical protein